MRRITEARARFHGTGQLFPYKGENNEMLTVSWHSVESPVYHNDTLCHVGNNIEPENKRWGRGGWRTQCQVCLGLQSPPAVPTQRFRLRLTPTPPPRPVERPQLRLRISEPPVPKPPEVKPPRPFLQLRRKPF